MKTEDWGDSRWAFTKDRSNWHFDTNLPASEGHDSYTAICKFNVDFTNEVKECIELAKPVTWAGRNLKDTEVYSANVERNDLVKVGADPDMELFDRAQVHVAAFDKIGEFLGLENVEIKFHNQRPGQMISQHIDNFSGRAERGNSYKEISIDIDPGKARRFMIFLEDWKLGQFLSMGNAVIGGWHAGECITWEWQDMPHGSANTGWENRPLIIITGNTTERTDEVLKHADKNLQISL